MSFTRIALITVARGLRTGLITLVLVLVAWQGLLLLLDISPFLAKGPLDVWTWLVTVPDAADNRALILGNLVVTLGDAFLGFVAGLTCALLLAVLFTLSRGIEHALMPIALLLRSVPLVALVPIISLITGRGLTTAVVMGAIVVLFPALVNIAFGLRSSSPQIGDVITVYGGSAFTTLRKVALPSSLPSFFAAVKISVPGAITGALLAEWLTTGQGLGNSIVAAVAKVQNSEVWASVVVITIVSLALYGLAQVVENLVLRRMSMEQSTAG
ncbi:ABC transporter permease subunit [Cryobacterium sp. TMT1-3]|uniref:ABC transporter permease subunit n=1 Tax=Cryobacterium luteum TaxID=1424661 RepID=A0A1H8GPC2_9MICO|nr:MULTISPECIES: ABC transporter permease subunit [Cryobacterium]TFB84635.1 ABC transporter permease subunit [Cryobacterium luteum]TFC28415.1 ABC transporter permease subunit [Cryobacterium sp. TMT1-3]SEN45843.1 ABC-type nitrate/sulfonate/bicarbonate transport system, permease component [Cryobacterium luteum]